MALLGLAFLAGCATPPPPGPPPAIASFGDFRPVSGRAHYLACPRDYCLATPDLVTPIRSIAAADLRDIVRKTLDAEPRTILLSSANEGLRLVYRQAPSLFDAVSGTITVEVVDVDEGLSGLVLYGEADGAGSDSGAIAGRVRGWLADIDRAASQLPAH